jgi:hypothetical protein
VAKKAPKKQANRPKTTPEFEQAIKVMVNTPPISNKEIIERSRKSKRK